MESLTKGVDSGHLTHIGCQFRTKFQTEYAPLPRIFCFVRCHKSSIILLTFKTIGTTTLPKIICVPNFLPQDLCKHRVEVFRPLLWDGAFFVRATKNTLQPIRSLGLVEDCDTKRCCGPARDLELDDAL